MQSLKLIHKFFALATLLLTLISFSEFTNNTAQHHKPQTELVSSVCEIDSRTITHDQTNCDSEQKVTINQYVVFNFRSLLKSHRFNFILTFKFQKQAVFQFRAFNNILERNLIAHTQTEDTHHTFIE